MFTFAPKHLFNQKPRRCIGNRRITMKKVLNCLIVVAIAVSATFTSCEKEKTFIVSFNSNGGTAVASQTVENGARVTKPADPTRENDVFDGWYRDAALTNIWNFNTDVVTSNVTLYAKWNTEVASGTLFETLTWVLSTNGTLTVSGSGGMPIDMTDWGAPWRSVEYRNLITTVVVEEGVANIGSFAFQNLPNLTSAFIPSSVTFIGWWAFDDCPNLVEVVNRRTTPQSINGSVFQAVEYSNATLRVPANSLDAYRNAAIWRNFGTIVAIE